MVSLGCDCVKVIDDFGGGCCRQQVEMEAYVVYASFGRFAGGIGNSRKGVSFSCMRRKRGREEDVGLSQEVEEI